MLVPSPQAPSAPLPGQQPPAPAPAPKWHDVTITTKRTYEHARVEPIPPEEFGIERKARSLRNCGYCYHEVLKTESELIDQGYDRKEIEKLPTSTINWTTEAMARDTVDETRTGQGDDSLNSANRTVKITEHYIRMDYEGTGKTRLYQITTGGEVQQILKREGYDAVCEIDAMPFAAMTPVIMTHRFFGRSIADLVMDIQRVKTALTRGMLDNLYLHNNPRVEVAEAFASETTLDDLLVSRPGGIVRTKQPGGLNWQEVPDITSSIYPALQYFDATREWRTGVSRQGQGVDPNALQNQVATIANQMFNASQAKLKLIARIFAETGIRDLFQLLHGTIRRNGSQAQTVRLRNQWIDVDPRDWKERNDMTVHVGLGTGSRGEQLQQAQLLIAAQEKAIPLGMVSPMNAHASAKLLTKLIGHQNTDEFFTAPNPNNPASRQPIPPPPDPKQSEIQAKSQAEQAKMQADQAHQQMKTQADIALQQKKMELDSQQAQMKFQLDRDLALTKAQLYERVATHNAAMKEHELQIKASQQKQAKAMVEVKHGADELTGPLSDAISQFGQHLAHSHAQASATQAQQLEIMQQMLRQANAPKRVVRGKDGKVSHVETMN